MTLKIQLSSERIRIGTSVLCSISDFEDAMASRKKSQSVTLEVAAETRSEILARVIQVLGHLGFDDYTITGPGSPGWFLYPPQPDVDLDGCG